MRRHGRSIHRKRIAEETGEPDALALALPGLACGLVALVIVLFAATLHRPARSIPLLPIDESLAAAPVASASLAQPDSSSLTSLTSALRARSGKP